MSATENIAAASTSLRDHFASLTMQVFCTAALADWNPAAIAADAYEMADAMLEARMRSPIQREAQPVPTDFSHVGFTDPNDPR